MAESKENELLVLYIMFTTVILVVCYMFVFKPKMKELSELKITLQEAKDKVEEAEMKVARKDFLEKQIDMMKDEIQKYESRLPSRKEIPELLATLKDIADETHVKINSLEPQEDQAIDDQGVYFELPVKLELESSYHSLGKFIGQVESMERFVKVKDLQVQKNKDSRHLHKIDLTFNTYVYSETVQGVA